MFIFRFLQIVSLACLCSLLGEMVSCHSLSAGLEKGASVIIRNHTSPLSSSSSQVIQRTYKLYNQCSGRHVQVIGKTVNAKGTPHSPNVNLSFVSAHLRHHPSAMNIVGTKSGRYLCFNKKGKLITRLNGKKRLCLFKEDFSEHHYTIIQSLSDPSWYLGFNRKGKPLRADQYSKPKLRGCYHFVKRNHSYGLDDSRRPGPAIKDPSKLKDLLKGRRSPILRIRRKIIHRPPLR